MNDEFIKEWLQWVLDFIKTDISKFSLSEKHRFFQKFIWFSGPSLFNTSFDPFGRSIQFSPNEMIELQSSTSDIQITLKRFIDQMTTTRTSYELPEFTSFIRPEGTMTRDPRVYFQTHSIPKDPTPQNYAVLNLSKLIQGIEMHVIGKCEECQRYFLNFSLREKLYCTPRCASKSTARLRRERLKKNPKKWKAYKKSQRKLMNKKYEEERQALGKTVHHRRKTS